MAVLACAAALTFFALFGLMESPALLPGLIPLGLGSAVFFLLAFALTRSLRLAAYAACATLACAIWPMGIAASLAFGHTAQFLPVLFPMTVIAGAVLLRQIAAYAADTGRGMEANAAAAASRNPGLRTGAMALLVAGFGGALRAWPSLPGFTANGIAAAGEWLTFLFLSSAVLPAFLVTVAAHEDVVAKANRAREWRENALLPVSALALPRWGFSVLGIAAVLTATIFFSDKMQILPALWRAGGVSLAAIAAAAGFCSALAARDWRAFAAGAAAPLLASSAGVWLAVHASPDLAPQGGAILLMTAANAGAGTTLLLGAQAFYGRLDETVEMGFLRAVLEFGVVLAAAIVAAMMAAPFAAGPAWSASLVLVLCVSFALGIILLAALSAVLRDLFPRYRSVEELYGTR